MVPVRTYRWRRSAIVVALAALAGAIVGAGVVAATEHHPSDAVAPTKATPDVPALLTKCLPGVVSIEVRLPTGGVATGTGMVVSSEGEVLTSAHLVRGAESITVVRYGTGRALSAHLVGTCLEDDLALVVIDGQRGLPKVKLGDSSAVPLGAFVLAVGDALGRSAGTPIATVGIVSAEGRSALIEIDGHQAMLQNLLQTDATTAADDSGGPLFDAAGRVIGVNTAVAGAAEGKGFAIPVNEAKEIVSELRAGAAATAAPGAFLGIQGLSLTASISAADGLIATEGVLISRVMAGSPAESAGLLRGDAIVAVHGTPVADTIQLRRLLRGFKPSQHVEIQVVRWASNTTFSVTLASAPSGSVVSAIGPYL